MPDAYSVKSRLPLAGIVCVAVVIPFPEMDTLPPTSAAAIATVNVGVLSEVTPSELETPVSLSDLSTNEDIAGSLVSGEGGNGT